MLMHYILYLDGKSMAFFSALAKDSNLKNGHGKEDIIDLVLLLHDPRIHPSCPLSLS
jgi:hypothetical protein